MMTVAEVCLLAIVICNTVILQICECEMSDHRIDLDSLVDSISVYDKQSIIFNDINHIHDKTDQLRLNKLLLTSRPIKY